MQRKIIFLTIIFILFCVGMMNSGAYAETLTKKIFGKYNALYQWYATTTIHEGFTYFENKTYVLDAQDLNQTDLLPFFPELPDAIPVGVYNSTIYYSMYIIIDLHEIPQSDLWNSRTIQSIQMKAFVDQFATGYEQNKTMITVSYCLPYFDFQRYSNNILNESNQRVAICPQANIPLDSIVVKKDELPEFVNLDLTNANDVIQDSIRETKDTFSFIVGADFMPHTFPSSTSSDNALVKFYSFNDAASEKLGVTVVPSITITYTEEPSQFQQSGIFFLTDALPALGVIGTALGWFVRREAKKVRSEAKADRNAELKQ